MLQAGMDLASRIISDALNCTVQYPWQEVLKWCTKKETRLDNSGRPQMFTFCTDIWLLMNPINIEKKKKRSLPKEIWDQFYFSAPLKCLPKWNEINLWTKIIVFCCLLASIIQYLTYSLAFGIQLRLKPQMRWWVYYELINNNNSL